MTLLFCAGALLIVGLLIAAAPETPKFTYVDVDSAADDDFHDKQAAYFSDRLYWR